MATTRPPRVMDPYAAEFWEFTKQRELRMQTCDDCGKLRWPAAAACDRCLSTDYTWTLMSGRGKALSWINFHRQYFPEYPAPHPALAVELDEGPIFVCCGPPELEASALRVDMPMQLDWLDAEDRFGEYQLPVFKPAG